MVSRRSPVRGPGSNQHADKPPQPTHRPDDPARRADAAAAVAADPDLDGDDGGGGFVGDDADLRAKLAAAAAAHPLRPDPTKMFGTARATYDRALAEFDHFQRLFAAHGASMEEVYGQPLPTRGPDTDADFGSVEVPDIRWGAGPDRRPVIAALVPTADRERPLVLRVSYADWKEHRAARPLPRQSRSGRRRRQRGRR